MAERDRKIRERVSAPPGYKWSRPRVDQAVREMGPKPGEQARLHLLLSCRKTCRNKRSAREYLKRVHGFTPDDLKTMVEARAGLCSICLCSICLGRAGAAAAPSWVEARLVALITELGAN